MRFRLPAARQRPAPFKRWTLLAALLVFAAGCASPRVVRQPADPHKYTEQGVASWYGQPFHGRKTASGERYDMHALTAAHPTLPFGVVVRVTNRDNGRTVKVRINDRGPFKKGRIIDLSKAAAKRLRMIGPGTAPVKLEVVRP